MYQDIAKDVKTLWNGVELAKNGIDQELNYMVHLLEADPGDTGDVVSMANNSIKDMESHVRTFKAANEE